MPCLIMFINHKYHKFLESQWSITLHSLVLPLWIGLSEPLSLLIEQLLTLNSSHSRNSWSIIWPERGRWRTLRRSASWNSTRNKWKNLTTVLKCESTLRYVCHTKISCASSSVIWVFWALKLLANFHWSRSIDVSNEVWSLGTLFSVHRRSFACFQLHLMPGT